MATRALLLVLVSVCWPEPARGLGSGARPAAPAVADRSDATTALPALELLRVGERNAVIGFHMPRLPGRPPATNFKLRVASLDGVGDEELRKIAVKPGTDCAATDGCKVAQCPMHHFSLCMRCECPAYTLITHGVRAVRRKSSGCSRARGTSSRSPRWRGEEEAAFFWSRTRRRLWGTTRHLSRSPPWHRPPHRPASRRLPPPLLPPPNPLFCHLPPARAKARPCQPLPAARATRPMVTAPRASAPATRAGRA